MIPSKLLSDEELVEQLRHLADLLGVFRRVAESLLQQSAATNRQASAIERLIPPFEQLRHDIYDLKQDRETDNARVDLAIARIGTDIQLTLDNIKRAQTDVRELQRDVTGAFPLSAREPRKSKFVEIIETFEKLKVSTKILVLIALLLAAASGWLTHLLAG